MRIITYRANPQEAWQAGIEDNGRVVAATAVYSYGEQLPTVRVLLEAGPAILATVLANAREILEAGDQAVLEPGQRHPLLGHPAGLRRRRVLRGDVIRGGETGEAYGDNRSRSIPAADD